MLIATLRPTSPQPGDPRLVVCTRLLRLTQGHGGALAPQGLTKGDYGTHGSRQAGTQGTPSYMAIYSGPSTTACHAAAGLCVGGPG